MEAIIERCCGMDVHRDIVVACVLTGPPEARTKKEIRTFGNHNDRTGATAGLASTGRLHTRGHGVDGSVLGTGVYGAGGALRTDRW